MMLRFPSFAICADFVHIAIGTMLVARHWTRHWGMPTTSDDCLCVPETTYLYASLFDIPLNFLGMWNDLRNNFIANIEEANKDLKAAGLPEVKV